MHPDCCGKIHRLLGYGLQNLRLRLNLPPAGGDPSHPVTEGVVVVSRTSGRSRPGKLTTLRLYSSTNVDPVTRRGRLSAEASLRGGKNTKHGDVDTVTYHVYFVLEPEFGVPGAMVVKNGNKHEFFLRFAKLEAAPGGQSVHFECNSWVYPINKTITDRLFFSNTSYLPSRTPDAIRGLREEELVSLRGNGRGERKEWERVYDYDCYNDLGDPSRGQAYVRPVLGGSKEYPYPRRGRTGRPLMEQDGKTETRHKFINLDFYVPPDERFSPNKLSEFITSSIRAVVHFVMPEVASLFQGDITKFKSLDEMTKDLYSNGDRRGILETFVMGKMKTFLPEELYQEVVRTIKDNSAWFPVPQVISLDKLGWKNDEEFGREMLAGINPAVIRCLKTFPPAGSTISLTHIQNNLDGLTIKQAMNQWRIFMLDHHDYLMPHLKRINEQGVCMYASRTVLFLRNDSSLKPLVVELSLPSEEEGKEINRIILPASQGTEAAVWHLAKTHVAAADSGHHQLISHWLHTHAVVEPFIIATRRQLSAMHPVHKLLHPHFKDTMHINSLARSVLLNAGGILEKTMYPSKLCMELSSKLYRTWRFDEQALPKDLLKRRLALEDSDKPSGIHQLFVDYPYASDGVEVWGAINKWVAGFCEHFYADDLSVSSDAELQSWWDEIKNVGHGDKRDEPWWTPLNSIPNLVTVLTTLVWIASALHASVNFGQYAYAGFLPNRPPKCRRFIPEEGTPEFAELIRDPDGFLMETLPERFTGTLGLALIEVLSRHIGDEVYLGRRAEAAWTDDEVVVRLFEEFGAELKEVEERVKAKNRDGKLRNRRGPVGLQYTLLFPDTSNTGSAKGITGRGIPNSVSI